MTHFLLILCAVLVVIIGYKTVRRVTVFEYERGLKYTKGRFDKVLEPGQYWYLTFFSRIDKVDMRPRPVSVPGQEVLSLDGVPLKASVAASYAIADPVAAAHKVQESGAALYQLLQLALREIIGSESIENVLQKRAEMGRRLMEIAAPQAQEFGLQLQSVNVKDIMFPGQLKDTFARVVKARMEGQAALEKARGETATLRHLANAARIIDSNPNLLQLRILQTIDGATGNTVVLSMPPQSTIVPVGPSGKPPGAGAKTPPENTGNETT